MSLLIVSALETPKKAQLRSTDSAVIAETLARYGVGFERWATRSLPADVSPDDVLKAYAPEVERLTRERGYPSVDVVHLFPSPADEAWPQKAAGARAKFRAEHTHGEDEVRFFVDGAGLFCLRFEDAVLQVLCEAGDLLSVPGGTRHWFDMGEAPSFRVLRFFGTPDGWIATFTGDDVAQRFPDFDTVRGARA